MKNTPNLKVEKYVLLIITGLKYESRRYKFTHHILLKIRHIDGAWVVVCDELDLLSYGTSYQESRDSFDEQFDFLWESIGSESDANLTLDARRLKSQLRKLVVAVPTPDSILVGPKQLT